MDTKDTLSDFRFVGDCIKTLTIKNPFIIIPQGDLKKMLHVDYVIDQISEDEHFLLGIIVLKIDIQIPHEQNKFVLKMELQGCFQAPKGSDQKLFEEMLSINGASTLYSIARAIIISITSQTFIGGNSITLPMINIIALKKKIDEEKIMKEKAVVKDDMDTI